MRPEEELALRQGGKMLKLKQKFDSLYSQFQDQQGEKEQQVQQVFSQGDTYLKGLQTIQKLEALLEQIKVHFTSQGQGISGLPFLQVQEMAQDLQRGLQQEGGTARKELQKSLQQAATSLLQGLEVGREINILDQLQRLAGQCTKELEEMAGEYVHPAGKEGDADVGYNTKQQDP